MLETPEERIKLLRAGFAGKTIERLYIKGNNFKIISAPATIELVELDVPQKTCTGHEAAVECT